MIKPYREVIKDFASELLKQRLALCHENQRALFEQIYPNGVSEENFDDAMSLVERTLNRNGE